MTLMIILNIIIFSIIFTEKLNYALNKELLLATLFNTATSPGSATIYLFRWQLGHTATVLSAKPDPPWNNQTT